jgi:NADP-dependent 3-hydroxy acid dehydrogenase YdfG
MAGMLDEFHQVASALTFHPPTIPIMANLDGDIDTPEYWVRHVREAVHFADGMRALEEAGVTTYLEVGPDGVLAAMGQTCVQDGAFLPMLRAGRDEPLTAVTALAGLHVRGVAVDWPALLSGGRRIDLPTYAFQHQRYWPRPSRQPRAGDVAAVGLGAADHPLLGAAVPLAGGDGLLLTGALSPHTHPWLTEHVIGGSVVLPAAAMVELAVQAGDQVGCDHVEELTLGVPLTVPDRGVHLQIVIGAAGPAGEREMTLYSRTPGAAADEPWTRHAIARLTTAGPAPAAETLTTWPPTGAEEQPALPGLRAVWRHGDDLYTEVEPIGDPAADGAFRLHPALLEAALRPLGAGGTRYPYSWTGVRLHAEGASTLRVRLRSTGPESAELLVADGTGQPVLTADGVELRTLGDHELQHTRQDALFTVEWTPVTGEIEALGAAAHLGDDPYAGLAALRAAMADGAQAPEVAYATATGTGEPGSAEAARTTARDALALLQDWLADERLDGSRLVLITHGSVAAQPGDTVPDLPGAAVRGLVRSAQKEYPGRFVLADLDGTADPATVAAAVSTGEPEVAVRGGRVLAPRLVRATTSDNVGAAGLDPDGTVLITGSAAGLGGIVARHLAATHGVRHLVFASRSGAAAAGAEQLGTDLAALGTELTLAACDVADRDALDALLGAIPAGHPLTAVVHTAAVLDDGVIESMRPEQLDRAARPKIDAVLALHEATRGLDLAAFVLFSSVAGVLGGAGQGSYTATNVFLDAFAQHRRAAGLPATSLAWGLWDAEGGMAGRAGEAGLHRASRTGVLAMSSDEACVLLDAVLPRDEAFLVPARLDLAALRAEAAPGPVPHLLRSLVRTPVRAVRAAAGSAGGTFADRLTGRPAAEQDRILLDLVRTHTATVLGHAGPESIESGRAFQELGFDSLTAVELRNRLNAATGLRLRSVLVFDYPTPAALAAHLRDELIGTGEPEDGAAVADEADLRRTLATIPLARLRAAGLLDTLVRLARTDTEPTSDEPAGPGGSIDEMDLDSLVQMALDGNES